MALGGADGGMVVPAAGALGILVQLHLDGQAGECLAAEALALAVNELYVGDDEQGLEVMLLQALKARPGLVVEVEGESGVGGLLLPPWRRGLPPAPC